MRWRDRSNELCLLPIDLSWISREHSILICDLFSPCTHDQFQHCDTKLRMLIMRIFHFSESKKAILLKKYLNSISQSVSVSGYQVQISFIKYFVPSLQVFIVFSVTLVLPSPKNWGFSIDLISNKKVVFHQTHIIQLKSSQKTHSPLALFDDRSIIPGCLNIFG